MISIIEKIMPRILLIILLVLLISSLFIWRYFSPVYVYVSDEHFLGLTEEWYEENSSIIYFWTDKSNSVFFDVGEKYIIFQSHNKAEIELFSVTYASMKPNDIKLGFYISDELSLHATVNSKFRIIRKPDRRQSL